MIVSKSRKGISVAIATHVAFSGNDEIFGPSHSLVKYIIHQGYTYLIIKQDLQHSGIPPIVETNQQEVFKIQIPRIFSKLNFLGDMLTNFFITIKLGKIDLFVGVDSVNSLTGLLFRFFGRTKSLVYYSVDYSPSRFGIPVLDLLYRVLDKFCAKHADETWSVSTRICELRRRQNLSNSRNVYMPNSPEYGSFKIYPPNEIKRHSLVIVANLSESLDFALLVEAMEHVKKHVPDARLDVIGNGPAYAHFVNLVKQNQMDKTIFFLGYMNHNGLELTLGKYVVGLAIYSGKGSWHYYCDSFKVREYLAAGIPVVLNSVTSTSDDIKNAGAGEVVNLSAEAFSSSIVSFLTQSDKWTECRSNAIRLSKSHDKKVLFDKAFNRLVGSEK